MNTAQLSNNLVYAAMAAYVVALLALAAAASFGSRSHARELVLAGGDVAPPDPVPAGQRADRLGGIGATVFGLGTLLLAGAVLTRGLAAGRVPWGNMYEFAITGALVVAVVYLLAARRWELQFLGVWVVATLLLTLGLAIAVLYVPAGPLVPALRSYWLLIHVLAAIVSAAVFTVSMVLSALHLVRDRAERLGRGTGYAGALPSAVTLERLAYRVTAFGFPIWTFAVIAGAIWAEASWGRYWNWDPKETWAFITWLVYAAYLHARTTAGWRGRRASVVSLVGYATLLFNFFGVNIFFAGLHSYGGV